MTLPSASRGDAREDDSPYHRLERPPAAEQTPVLVEVPHAGLAIPDAVRGEMTVPREGIARDADIYVDKLYAGAAERGASLLATRVSRYVVDLNRAEDDVDLQTVPDHPAPRGVQPRGVVWRMTTDGRPLLKRPLTHRQLERRLDLFHRPYHGALRSELDRLRARFGYSVVLAGHSMPSVGRSLRSDRIARRADVVPGTRGRSSAHPDIIDLVDSHFREAGLSVRHDDPYRGGFTTAHYGRPRERVHAVQLELNRALYVHEATGEPKTQALEALRVVLLDLVSAVGRLQLR
ncbi:MAG: N-formylglutamate amidohydrolase [Sandaracinus sp.]|nr:N-formylglutamate amidohydrolase [Sandaracinus sp.]|tara:strand:- start:641 stop:1513 length:873 start_codon:yes stop_codon:yes gene_type:complete